MNILQLALFNTNWHDFWSYLAGLGLTFVFVILSAIGYMYLEDHNFKHRAFELLLIIVWVASLILFMAFMYATFGPWMFMRWN